jgi:hypothetical protein
MSKQYVKSRPLVNATGSADITELLNRNPSMRLAMQAMLSTDLSKKLARRAPTFQGKIQLPL